VSEPFAERGNDSAVGSGDHAEARIAGRVLIRCIDSAIGRSVVHDDALPIGIGLSLNAAQTRAQGFAGFEDREQDRGSGSSRAREHSASLASTHHSA
jgi:hypothetical protein